MSVVCIRLRQRVQCFSSSSRLISFSGPESLSRLESLRCLQHTFVSVFVLETALVLKRARPSTKLSGSRLSSSGICLSVFLSLRLSIRVGLRVVYTFQCFSNMLESLRVRLFGVGYTCAYVVFVGTLTFKRITVYWSSGVVFQCVFVFERALVFKPT